jgi:hypothetical protein
MALKINGYTIIASLRAWQEWEVEKDDDGIRLDWLVNQQDDVSSNKIEEWTFNGLSEDMEYCTGDYNFDTFEELKAYLSQLPKGEKQ